MVVSLPQPFKAEFSETPGCRRWFIDGEIDPVLETKANLIVRGQLGFARRVGRRPHVGVQAKLSLRQL
jgi:hypothetical protein